MLKNVSFALIVGVSTFFGVFEAPAQAKQYESPDAYCTEQKNSVPQSLSEKDAVYDRCMQAIQDRPDKFPDVKISQGKSESSEERAGTVKESDSSVVVPNQSSPQIQKKQNSNRSVSKSESELSKSEETSSSSPSQQQQPEGPNGTESTSNDDFGAFSGNQSEGNPLSTDQTQDTPSQKKKINSPETQTEEELTSVETQESLEEAKQIAEQKVPEETQEESVLDEKESESTEETEKSPGEKKQSAKQENVSDQEKNGLNKTQLSEKKVDRFCGKQNVMAGTGSKEVYNRCITQVKDHPGEFPQLHQSETTKPSVDSGKKASASDASLASENTESEASDASDSENQEYIEKEEERKREGREKDGKVQTETSADQKTPNEGENAEKGNNDPPQKLRNMSHSELYDRFCNVKEISGDAPRQKMVQKVVNKHVQCHKRMIRAIQKEKYAQMRTMIQQQRKKMQEERPTLEVKAAAQFSGNGDLQTRVGVQDQRFNAQAVYRPNSERSLDVSATHQITGKEDNFPLNVLTPVRVGAGLKNMHGETSIGPRVKAGILDLQVDVVNGNGVSAGINIFNF